ncbi:hypothetical protein HPG69_002359 [Diceros bicornis minor]|uniref:peptidylprolyl isomerase n=1 Tax=Diceros bicornis minor TaxID=77932 RepID=A0A7J7FP33_DICBM|nr:hypothetical protein HPG69_002359 [Diceros bicornis minor]
MTTDEGAKNSGGSPAAAVAERGEDITSRKDRGVLKIVKRLGNSEETPMIGDKVYVHYKGKLSNGKKFDSSHDRNEPFVFSLGKGASGSYPCQNVFFPHTLSLDNILQLVNVREAVMVPNEKKSQVIKAWDIGVATMKKGEIELLDFKGEDLFEDGGIIRRIKQKGEGYSNPNEGATVENCAFLGNFRI